MFGLGGKSKAGLSPIGIAVTASEVYLAQLGTRDGDQFAVQSLPHGIDPAGPGYHSEVSRLLSAMLRRGKFAGKHAVSALPAESLVHKTLRLPPMPDEDLEQAVAWEAAERFQIAGDQAVQFYNAGVVHQGNEKRQEIILLAADQATINDHALSIKRAGLVPLAIDASSSAFARVLGFEHETALVVNLQQSRGEIVGTRGDQVIFSKPIGLQRLNDELDQAGLARELSLCLRYLSVTFGVHQPEAAWLSGMGASPQLAAELSENLSATLRYAGESPALSGLRFPDGDPSPWLVAVGLAMRGRTHNVQRGAA